MKLCNENKIPVTVRGAGTGLVGGSTPLRGGVVLCTMHMNEILEYDMNNLFVRVSPAFACAIWLQTLLSTILCIPLILARKPALWAAT